MKILIRLFFLVIVLALFLSGLTACQAQPIALVHTAVADAGTPAAAEALSGDDLAIAAIAALGGSFLSYILNTLKGPREWFNTLPSDAKPYVLLAFFLIVTGALATANCYNLYSSAVTCPAGPPDYVRLVFWALSAWSGAFVAHTKGGGKEMAAANRYRVLTPTVKG